VEEMRTVGLSDRVTDGEPSQPLATVKIPVLHRPKASREPRLDFAIALMHVNTCHVSQAVTDASHRRH
jgi:hypothetical protein